MLFSIFATCSKGISRTFGGGAGLWILRTGQTLKLLRRASALTVLLHETLRNSHNLQQVSSCLQRTKWDVVCPNVLAFLGLGSHWRGALCRGGCLAADRTPIRGAQYSERVTGFTTSRRLIWT